MSAQASQAESDAIHEAIQANAQPVVEDGEGVVLTGWAIVAEWMHADGSRTLTRMHPAGGTLWQAKGFWHEALFAAEWDNPNGGE